MSDDNTTVASGDADFDITEKDRRINAFMKAEGIEDYLVVYESPRSYGVILHTNRRVAFEFIHAVHKSIANWEESMMEREAWLTEMALTPTAGEA